MDTPTAPKATARQCVCVTCPTCGHDADAIWTARGAKTVTVAAHQCGACGATTSGVLHVIAGRTMAHATFARSDRRP
jgi:transcription elongation factor Elf1